MAPKKTTKKTTKKKKRANDPLSVLIREKEEELKAARADLARRMKLSHKGERALDLTEAAELLADEERYVFELEDILNILGRLQSDIVDYEEDVREGVADLRTIDLSDAFNPSDAADL